MTTDSIPPNDDNFKDEQWKDVVGYEGIYAISDYGRLKRIKSGIGAIPGYILSNCTRNGYPFAGLRKDGETKHFYVHRLVLLAFAGEDSYRKYANHKNGVRTDNRLENLEWTTPKENVTHARDVLGKDNSGERHYAAKLTESSVKEIRRIYSLGGISYAELGRKFGVCGSSIRDIIIRKNWKHI
jgi:hypothetical protein